jgi:hypothetical protein
MGRRALCGGGKLLTTVVSTGQPFSNEACVRGNRVVKGWLVWNSFPAGNLATWQTFLRAFYSQFDAHAITQMNLQ